MNIVDIINLVLIVGGLTCLVWACVLVDSRRYARAAIAALVGVSCLYLWFSTPLISPQPIRARIARTVEDLHNIALAVESFYTDEGRYPTLREFCDASLLNDGIPADIPDATRTLTSPVPYMRSLPGDVWRYPQWHFGYWTDGKVFVLRSYGPDKARTADLAQLGAYLSACGPGSATAFASPEWREQYAHWMYDMSNGLTSRGDLIKTGP